MARAGPRYPRADPRSAGPPSACRSPGSYAAPHRSRSPSASDPPTWAMARGSAPAGRGWSRSSCRSRRPSPRPEAHQGSPRAAGPKCEAMLQAPGQPVDLPPPSRLPDHQPSVARNRQRRDRHQRIASSIAPTRVQASCSVHAPPGSHSRTSGPLEPSPSHQGRSPSVS